MILTVWIRNCIYDERVPCSPMYSVDSLFSYPLFRCVCLFVAFFVSVVSHFGNFYCTLLLLFFFLFFLLLFFGERAPFIYLCKPHSYSPYGCTLYIFVCSVILCYIRRTLLVYFRYAVHVTHNHFRKCHFLSACSTYRLSRKCVGYFPPSTFFNSIWNFPKWWNVAYQPTCRNVCSHVSCHSSIHYIQLNCI